MLPTTMLPTTTVRHPATDPGYLLHEHPTRIRKFAPALGEAQVCYPEARTISPSSGASGPNAAAATAKASPPRIGIPYPTRSASITCAPSAPSRADPVELPAGIPPPS